MSAHNPNRGVHIRRILPKDEATVQALLIAGFKSNNSNFLRVLALNYRWHAAFGATAFVVAAAAWPAHWVEIATLGATIGGLAWLGLRQRFFRIMDDYIKKAITDDLGSIATYYTEESKGAGTSCWVAESDEGQILGCVALHRRTDEAAEFRRLSVSKHARGRGIASRLTAHVTQVARASGAKKLFLTTSTGQPAAIQLYTKAGWKVTETTDFGGIHVKRFELELASLPDSSIASAHTSPLPVDEPQEAAPDRDVAGSADMSMPLELVDPHAPCGDAHDAGAARTQARKAVTVQA